MKYLIIAVFGLALIHFTSCNNELEVSAPEIIPVDTVDNIHGLEYYLNVVISDTSMSFKSNRDQEATGVYKNVIDTCGFLGMEYVQFYSYFSRVADTNHNEIVSFGLINCVSEGANGFNDSTYLERSFQMGNYLDTTTNVKAFIEYLDKDTVLWSSEFAQNGPFAQKNHSLTIETKEASYHIDSSLEITGTFSGWVYNGFGDSLKVTAAKFYSKAFAI